MKFKEEPKLEEDKKFKLTTIEEAKGILQEVNSKIEKGSGEILDFNKISLLLEYIETNYEKGKDDGYLKSLSDLLERKKDESTIFPPNRKYLQAIFERIEEILQRIEEKQRKSSE